jgi:hypothetical protein
MQVHYMDLFGCTNAESVHSTPTQSTA